LENHIGDLLAIFKDIEPNKAEFGRTVRYVKLTSSSKVISSISKG
jgi:hypothetical protein